MGDKHQQPVGNKNPQGQPAPEEPKPQGQEDPNPPTEPQQDDAEK